ncbi:MAG: tRNA dihydrouridine(20/20a) synthase DusA, partial [Pseudomonadota bacterium]
SMFDVLAQYRPYMEEQLRTGLSLHAMTRHMLGLFAGRPGARAYRRHLSENATRKDADISVFDEAVSLVRDAADRAAA